MAIKIRPATTEAVKAAMENIGIDIDHLSKDLAAHSDDISALLQRNIVEADAMRLRGTPVFLIGPFLVARELDEAGFRQIVAEARAHQKSDDASAPSK